MSLRNTIAPALLAAFLLSSARAEAKPEIMPLSEIEPGMKGVWKTVVTGTKIESFNLEVLGIAQNFVGPQRSVIICQALDPKNKLTGPVAGMSGSPVYIDDKLVGAYAYGYTWSKDQAVVGVTPIEQMLEVLDGYPPAGEAAPPRGGITPSPPAAEDKAGFEESNEWRLAGNAGRLEEEAVSSLLRPLPTPLLAAGISERALRVFKPRFEALGLRIYQAPSGGVSSHSDLSLDPGSPIAAVLMSGDFNIAATGTITYRDGDTLLAFGHPFFQMGPAQFPMAGAEIITVVQSLASSFKLSNTGPLVGSIYQDRLTAIAGKIGVLPPLMEVEISTRSADGRERKFRGGLVEHPLLSPLLASVSFLESLFSTMESSEKQTFYIDGTVELEGFDPIRFQNAASGPNGAVEIALGFLNHFQRLMNNPFGMPRVNAIRIKVEMRDEWLLSSLKAVQLENKRFHPGENVELAFTIYNYQDEAIRHAVSIPLPKGLEKGEKLTILVADAAEAERVEGASRSIASSLRDIISQWRSSKSRKAIYLKLLRKSPGLRFEGENMFDLPPSIRALYASPGNNIARQTLSETTLWETRIEVDGEFRGSYRVPLTME